MSEKHEHGSPRGQGQSADDAVDVRERGAPVGGEVQYLDRRLFMQLLVFEVAGDPSGVVTSLGTRLREQGVASVLYDDVNHPRGIGVLSFSEDPGMFVTALRPTLQREGLTLRPEFTMLGRSYSSGFEENLLFTLLERPRNAVLREEWNWHIWYPLKRSGAFNRLDGREQGAILREHGHIGRRYGEAGLVQDIRLASHGLDAHDNEFVIGLVGPALHPLSHVVQAMRKTRQTAEYMDHMGPFFVGRVAWRNA